MINEIKKNKLFIIVIVIIVIVLAGLIWFIFNREPNFVGDKVSFEVAGSRNIQSGGMVEYRVLYENEEGTSLKDVELTMIYPDGFMYESSSEKPENKEGNKWKIRKISSEDKDEITITGKLYGNPEDLKSIKAILNYTPAGVSSSYQEESELETKILKTDLSITSDYPKLVSSEDDIEYNIKVKNNEDFDVSNVRIKAKYPDGFEFIESDPGSSSDNNVWNFDTIKASEEKEIKIKQKVFGELEDEKSLGVEVGLFDNNGNYYKQSEEIADAKISKIDIDLKYTANKKNNLSVDQGEEVKFNLHYKNTGTEILPDGKVEIEINEEFLEEESIKVEDGRYEGGKIIWDDSKAAGLDNLKKGQEGNLKFSAKVQDNIDSGLVQEPMLKSKAMFTSSNSDTGVNFDRESNEIEIKINTKVEIGAIGRFYDFNNKKIGSGPIPPKVGKTTKYRIYLTVSNTTSDVNDGRVEISLPNNVSWTGVKEVEVGNLSFIDKKLVWDIGKIENDSIGEDKRLEANFEVGITPSDDQVGQFVTLVNKIIFTGKDIYSENEIKIETKSVNTNLEGDSNIKEEQGKVIGEEEKKED